MRVWRRVSGKLVDASIDPKDLVFLYGPKDTVPLSLQGIQKKYDEKKHDYLVLDRDGARLVKDEELFGDPSQVSRSWPILTRRYKKKIIQYLEDSQDDPGGLLGRVKSTRVGSVLGGLSYEDIMVLRKTLD